MARKKKIYFDQETASRFDKTTVVLSGRNHSFSAEYERGFRDRNDGKPSTAIPYSSKPDRDKWLRGWNARNNYTDAQYKWVEPVTDSKAMVWILIVLFFGGSFLFGLMGK